MPVRAVDRNAVEPGDLGVGMKLRDLTHLRLLVGDLRVDLAGDEVALPEAVHEFREGNIRRRQQLEDQKRRDGARVRAPEVAEVVVARDLAAERRFALAHGRLEEGVPDAVDERRTTE